MPYLKWNRSNRLSLALVPLLYSGCTLGPDYVRPDLAPPQNYQEPSQTMETAANLPWWNLFGDPALQHLIKTALEQNKDLQVAAARIEESRALLGFTRADQFPRLDVSGTASRTEPSKEIISILREPVNDFGVFTDLSWELDLWGRLRRATEAQRAELLSSEYAYRAVTVSLISQVASTYFLLVDLDKRYQISQGTLVNRLSATDTINSRFKGGVAPEIDLNQAQIEEASTEVNVYSFERQVRQAENAMSVLLGGYPQRIPRAAQIAEQDLPEALPTGFPAQLLETRSDVASAEETVRAEYARIGVAEAERLPTFSLSGFVGFQARDIDDIADARAFTWNIAADFLGPLLDFGKSESVVEAAEARAQQALKTFEGTVIQAVREVEDALIAVRTYRSEYRARIKEEKAARNAALLSRARYDQGVTPYLEVLDSERSLFSAELAVSESLQSYLNSIVALYKALGGGWQQAAA